MGGGDVDPGGFADTEGRDAEVVTSDTGASGGEITGATLEGKGATGGTRGGIELWSIGGAVLGPGSNWP